MGKNRQGERRWGGRENEGGGHVQGRLSPVSYSFSWLALVALSSVLPLLPCCLLDHSPGRQRAHDQVFPREKRYEREATERSGETKRETSKNLRNRSMRHATGSTL